MTIVREYIDIGKPARLTEQIELQHLLAALQHQRDTAYVVVSDYARLGRDLQSLNAVIQRIQDCGAEIATITGMEAAERFTSTRLLDEVAKWATQPPGDIPDTLDRQPTSNNELSAAIRTIRHGRLNPGQREALANLLDLAGQATLPTPIAAAVFNVVEACQRTGTMEGENDKEGDDL